MSNHETAFELHGARLRILRGGQGEPALFLHDAAGLSAWSPFFEALARQHELIVPEHPGWGKSDDPPWLRTMDDLAMFYMDFIDRLGLRNFHLIGHSLGGWLASEIAIRNCAILKTLTLIAPAGLRPDGFPIPDTLAWTPEQRLRNQFHDPAIAESALATPPDEEMQRLQEKSAAATARLGRSGGLHNPALEKWLPRIQVPALLIWGDDDKMQPSALAGHWARHLPNARVMIIPRCGHLPHAEKPHAVAPIVTRFLKGISAVG